jgi:hypothetical protein
MKIKISDLRKIIKEEVENVLKGDDHSIEILASELGAQVYDAHSVPGGENITAQGPVRTFSDGVPDLKAIARSKPTSVELPETFKVIDDNEYRWWYFKIGNLWYGIKQDGSSPPFDY